MLSPSCSLFIPAIDYNALSVIVTKSFSFELEKGLGIALALFFLD